MEPVVSSIIAAYPQHTFVTGAKASWSPRDNRITYTPAGRHAIAGLLHELAHALLGHTTYATDLDLLHKEIAAWEHAHKLARIHGVTLDDDHVQDCLDTYRDWLHRRSACPGCSMNGLQTTVSTYGCLNCGQSWRVSTSRFCRPYRRSPGRQTSATKKDQNDILVLSRFS